MEKTNETSHNAIYLLRTVQQHHVQLSSMADNKAGVLLGSSFVSLTILGAWAGTGAAKYAPITMAASVLLTAMFSVLALIPRSRMRPQSGEERNILFFGVFAGMKYEDFESEMREILCQDKEIFRAMLRDIYAMGVVQHEKKYRYLRFSYISFIVGLIASPIVAALEFMFPGLAG